MMAGFTLICLFRKQKMFAPKFKFLCCGLVIASAVLIHQGCGPRTEVITDKIKKAFDNQIGAIDVQMKELDNQIAALKLTSKELEKAGIKAKLEIEKISDRMKPLENRKKEIDEALSSLRTALKDSKDKNKPILIGKKEVKAEDFNSMVEKLVDARKPLVEQIENQDASNKSLSKVVGSLGEKESKIKSAISKFESKKVELASQKEAASAIQASSKAGASQNIDEQIKAVENKLSDIQSDIKMTLAESGSGSEQGKDISEIDSIIKQTKSPEDILSQLDKILGPSSK